MGIVLDIFFSHLSLLFFLSLSLGDGPIQTEILSQRAVKPNTTNQLTADSRRAVVSYWRKYVLEVLVNRLGGLSLPRKNVVKLTDRPDMTLPWT